MKGLRLAKATTLEEANRYLDQEFLPWWNQMLTVVPAGTADAHRPLGSEHVLASALSHVETRQVTSDYTIRKDGRIYRIATACIVPGLRGGVVRVEQRLDGSMAVRFRSHWLEVEECKAQPKRAAGEAKKETVRRPPRASKATTAERTAAWRATAGNLFKPGIGVYAAAAVDRTRTRDRLD